MTAPAIRVLYVDDEPVLLAIGKRYLEMTGDYTLHTLESAEEALDFLEKERVDAIISDYYMPRMDGIELLKAIRARGDDTPLIIFTGRGREEVVIEALNAGADFYLQKGGDLKALFVELGHIVKRAVGQRRIIDALWESEERYRNVVEDQTEFICRFLPDGTHVFVNEAYCRTFGLDREQIIGSQFRPQIPVEDQMRISQLFASLSPDSPVKTIEHRVVMQDGSIRWQRWNDRAIYRFDGSLKEYQSVGRDITELKEREELLRLKNDELLAATMQIAANEEELQHQVEEITAAHQVLAESYEKYRTVFENTGTATVVIEENSNICLANEEFVHLSGFSKEDLEGKKSWTEFVVKEDLEKMLVQHRLRRHSKEKALTHYEFRFVTQSGEIHTIFLTVDVIPGTTKSVASLRDITMSKLADDALRIQYNLAIALTTCRTQKEALALILDAALQADGLDAGGIYVADPCSGALELMVHQGLSAQFVAHTSHFDADTPHVQRLKTGTPYFGRYSDLRLPYEDEVREKEGITAIASIPVMHEGGLVALMNMASHTMHDIPVHTRQILETLAAQIGGTLVYIRSEQALRESEQKFRGIINQTFQFIGLMSTDGILIEANRSSLDFAGIKISDVLNKPFVEGPWWTHSEKLQKKLIEAIKRATDGEVVRFEATHLGRDGHLAYIDFSLKPVLDKSGDVIYLIPEGRDITERKSAENALRESQQMLQNILEHFPGLVSWKDRDFVYLGGNMAFARDAGLNDPTLIKGKTDYDLPWGRTEADRYRHDDLDVMTTGLQKLNIVERHLLADGRVVWFNTSKVPLFDEDGEVVGVLCSSSDITERKAAEEELKRYRDHLEDLVALRTIALTQANELLTREIDERNQVEQALRKSEELFRTLFNNALDAIFLHEMRPDWTSGQYILVNDIACQRLGHTRDELLTMTPQDIVSPEHLKKIPQISRMLQITKHGSFDAVHRRSDGYEFPVEITTHIFEVQGKTLSLSIARDITERKKDEEALRESEQRLRDIIDFLPDATMVIDRSGRVTAWNQAMEQITGVAAREILGKGDYEYAVPFWGKRKPILIDFAISPERQKMDGYDGSQREESTIFSDYFTPARGDGRLYLSAAACALRNSKGEIIGAIESIRDITARRQMETDLKESRQRLELALQGARLATWDWDIPHGRISRNDRWAEILDYGKNEDLSDFSFVESLIHPDDLARVKLAISDHFAGRVPTYNCEYRLKAASGEWKWVLDNGRVFERDLEGNSVRAVGILLDITERRLIEEELRESEGKFRALAEATAAAIMIYQDERWVYSNPAAELIGGYTQEELFSMHFWDITHPDFREQMRALGKIRIKESSSPPRHLELKIIRKDGEERWVDVIGGSTTFRRRNAGILTAIDITDRKIAETELKKSEEKYRSIFESIDDLYYQADAQGVLTNLSPSCKKLTGYMPDELIGRNVIELYPFPKQRADLLHDLFKNGSVNDYEVILKDKGGTYIPTSVNSHIIFDKQGNPAGFEGTLRDITERKQMEESIKTSEAQYRSLVNDLNVGVYQNTLESPGRWIWANPACLRIFGFDSLEECKSHTVTEVYFRPEDRKVLTDALMHHGFVRNFEMQMRRKDGTPIWVSLTTQIKGDQQEKAARIDGICEDITQRRMSQQALETYAKDLEQKNLELDALHVQLTAINQELDLRVKERTEQVEQLLIQKDEFITQAGHDLKTPLTPIIALLPHIYNKVQDPQLRELLEIVMADASVMKHLITDILTLAKLNKPYNTLNRKEMVLADEVTDAVTKHTWMADKKRTVIENCVSPDIRISISPTHLESLLSNLISNAIRYTPEGGRVTISSRVSEGSVKISVRDTGIGLSSEETTRIFDEFYKADSSRHERDSSGLGLSIVQRIAHLYGGTVEAESQGIGCGSTFTVTIPNCT
jgi:PAS domain S-box-containing protein